VTRDIAGVKGQIMKKLLWVALSLFGMSIPYTTWAVTPQVTEGFINAPLAAVWGLFTSPDGYKVAGATQAEVDLRIGGSIRMHQDSRGRLGDADTLDTEILAFDPQRMLALRIRQAPQGWPQRAAIDGTWTIIYFTPSGEDMTHVKIVGLGYNDTPGSQALRAYFEMRNRQTLDALAKPYAPQCARCKNEAAAAAP
jgi:uncharacterized protein YndB with AHSA1/START domain